MGRVLVLTTVHQAEDPRIRRRTVGVLAQRVPVRFAARPPAPVDTGDHEWVQLDGGRLRRAGAGLREAMRSDVALLSLHDPELIPLGIAVRLLRRIPVVFDVHEDVPGQVATKDWLPRWLRKPVAAVASVALRAAEATMTITLAEDGYAGRFARAHPVLPNYPQADALPDPAPDAGPIVYVGDVTPNRGALLAVRAVAGMRTPRPLQLIGRCSPALRAQLERLADGLGVDMRLPGFVPHPEALAAAASATVGLSPLADIPNYRDSLPTKVLEYLAIGVPVLASDLPGTASAVGAQPGVRLVPPGDVTAWTEALEEACAAPDLRAAAAANVTAVRRRFAWPAARLLQVYLALLDRDVNRADTDRAAEPGNRPPAVR